ncbi:MAG: DUF5320 domain-containing protein [Candidatus Izemoplasmataceae bacterium]
MPARDQRGPLGEGPMTGRGLGRCSNANRPQFGLGRQRGMRTGNRRFQTYQYTNDKDRLQEEKAFLEEQLKEINKNLEEL